jgi:thiol-disulfide isomerase/thioredoxin
LPKLIWIGGANLFCFLSQAELVHLWRTLLCMRYLFIFFCLLIIGAGCSPTPSDSSATVIPDTLQFKNNISTLYGNGAKNAADNTGAVLASNIIWKDSLGITQSLDSLRGKIILINFWATWCVPCDAEMPGLDSIAESMKPDVVVIGVSAMDPASSLFQRATLFAQTRGMKFQVITDQASKAYINYGGDGSVPWTFAIDRTGHIAYLFKGAQTKEAFMYILNQIP